MAFRFNPLTQQFDLVKEQVWIKSSFSIPASSSLVVYSADVNLFHGAEFTLSFKSSLTGNKKIQKMLISKLGANVSDTVFSIVGEIVSANISADVVLGNVEVVCLNNEASDVTLSLAQLIP